MESLCCVLERLPVQTAIRCAEHCLQQAAFWTCSAIAMGAILALGYVVWREATARWEKRR